MMGLADGRKSFFFKVRFSRFQFDTIPVVTDSQPATQTRCRSYAQCNRCIAPKNCDPPAVVKLDRMALSLVKRSDSVVQCFVMEQ